jgi:tetratricopeptide (TPR) repeat protein
MPPLETPPAVPLTPSGSDEVAPEIIANRYHLLDRIGQGGMGTVFRARDQLTGEIVALKRVRVGSKQLHIAANIVASDTTMQIALAHEFELLASLRHPNIISVLDYGFDDSQQPFYTMTLLVAPQTIVEAGRGQPLREQLSLLMTLLNALTYLHRRGVIHRDLKPANVLVTDERLKVVDFGLALDADHAKSDAIAGTLAYMSPEAISGGAASVKSDLYAVGIIAYELLTGVFPYDQGSSATLMRDILNREPDWTRVLTTQIQSAGESAPIAPAMKFRTGEFDVLMSVNTPSEASVRRGLLTILRRLTAKDPQRRYDNAAEVIDALHDVLGESLLSETDAMRESFLQAAQFVGRQHELQQLGTALEQARAGFGQTWLVGGTSGIGKSRLLNELATLALVRGVTVLRGQAVRTGGTTYQIWREPVRRLLLNSPATPASASILKAIVPDVDRLLGREHPASDESLIAAQLVEEIAACFGRITMPKLLLLEDLQWVRDEDLKLLEKVGKLTQNCPLLIVGSYRDDEAPTLPTTLAAIVPAAQTVTLERLTESEIAHLTESMLGERGRDPELVAYLERGSEGNVFFLVEIVRALAEDAGQLSQIGYEPLPDHVFAAGIEDLVRRRLARIPAHWLPMLKLAAAAGRTIDLHLLHHAEPTLNFDRWLFDCANAAVLEVHNGEWQFAHDKLRETLIRDLPHEERQALAGQLAEVIEAAYPGQPEHYAEIAYCAMIAENRLQEFTYSKRAGEHALKRSAYQQTVQFFERAQSLADEFTAEEVAQVMDQIIDLQGQLGEAYWRQGQIEAAHNTLTAGLQLAQQHDHQPQRGKILRSLSALLMAQGQYDAALPLLEEGLRIQEQMGDMLGQAKTLNNLALPYHAKGQFAEAGAYLRRAAAIFKRLGLTVGILRTLVNIGAVENDRKEYRAAAETLHEALSMFDNPSTDLPLELKADIYYNLAVSAQATGDTNAARDQLTRSLDIYREIGSPAGEVYCYTLFGELAVEAGDGDAGQWWFVRTLHLAPQIGEIPIALRAVLGLATALDAAGDPDRAFELARFVRDQPETNKTIVDRAASICRTLEARLSTDQRTDADARSRVWTLQRVIDAFASNSPA